VGQKLGTERKKAATVLPIAPAALRMTIERSEAIAAYSMLVVPEVFAMSLDMRFMADSPYSGVA
jgi:hypothetical protein